MNLTQLINELEELKSPLLNSRKQEAMQRVFFLYKAVTGREPRGRRCFQCAIDSYFELIKITSVGEGWDNSLNLIREIKQINKKEMANLKKYKMLVSSFRVFGSPDLLTPNNVTDEKIDAILKVNPQFEKFFQLIEKPAKKEIVLETLETLETFAETSEEKVIEEPQLLKKITKKKGGRYLKKAI